GAQILSGGGPGFTGLAYRSSDHRLSFAAAGKGLFVQSATAQCDNGAAGLDVKQFDRISLGGFGDSIADSSGIISPAQRASSPCPPTQIPRRSGVMPGPFGENLCPERSVVSQSPPGSRYVGRTHGRLLRP